MQNKYKRDTMQSFISILVLSGLTTSMPTVDQKASDVFNSIDPLYFAATNHWDSYHKYWEICIEVLDYDTCTDKYLEATKVWPEFEKQARGRESLYEEQAERFLEIIEELDEEKGVFSSDLENTTFQPVVTNFQVTTGQSDSQPITIKNKIIELTTPAPAPATEIPTQKTTTITTTQKPPINLSNHILINTEDQIYMKQPSENQPFLELWNNKTQEKFIVEDANEIETIKESLKIVERAEKRVKNVDEIAEPHYSVLQDEYHEYNDDDSENDIGDQNNLYEYKYDQENEKFIFLSIGSLPIIARYWLYCTLSTKLK